MAMLEHYGGPAVFLRSLRGICPGADPRAGRDERPAVPRVSLLQRPGGPDLGDRVHPARVRRRAVVPADPGQVGLWSLAVVGVIVVVAVVVRMVLKRRERRRLALEFADEPADPEPKRADERADGDEADRTSGRPGPV